jgi:hypothetical protein
MTTRIKKRILRPDHPDALARKGPRTAADKTRIGQNARRHGLSLPVLHDEGFCDEVDAMARRICKPAADTPAADTPASKAPAAPACDPEMLYLAQRIAEAQLEVMRVRRARFALVAGDFADPHFRTSRGLMARIAMLSQAGDMLNRGEPVPPATAQAILHRPQGADKYALILAEASAELIAMDRYERRALSRRKFAIRAYENARIAAMVLRLAKRRRDGRDPPAARNDDFGRTKSGD